VTSDSTHWPLLEERGPFATAGQGRRGRRVPRSVWLLTGLAFLCGGLVSAAGFSIGWRHQAQRDTAAQSALAAANTRAQKLERKIGTLRTSLGEARGAGANVAEEADVSSGNGAAISSSAGALTAAATRIAGELKTLDTYLTTTPTSQLDPGYVASQAAYLAQQLSRLQGDAGTLGNSIGSFEATLRKLSRAARALKSS
jgi:hypothetical protein